MKESEIPAAKRLPLPTRAVVAACNLNQWALDFDGNLQRIKQSIGEAKRRGARYRVGPELEITGYSCEDHFLEQDTYLHSDQSLADILSSDLTDGILCDIGLPVLHNNVRYNCRVFCLNRRIVFIRPKMFLADNGNYRENRFFTAWKSFERLEDHLLSDMLRQITGQTIVPFGFAMIRTADAVIASEACEELWTPRPPHIAQALAGVDIIGNGSGSYHQLRKLDTRVNLIRDATRKCGGVYLYSNQQGCDGQRMYFDGSSMICMNEQILAQASQFSVKDVEVITAVIDMQDIKSYRAASSSFQLQASMPDTVPSLSVPEFRVCVNVDHPLVYPTPPIQLRYHTPDEECLLGPACWLWDYLRRSGASGYFLPLSGGADSTSVAAVIHAMCTLVLGAIHDGDEQVKKDVLRITNGAELPGTPQELCNSLLHTSYMGSENSSQQTKDRAQRIADAIGAYHTPITIDTVVAAIVGVFVLAFGKTPTYASAGGTMSEDMALQNIQARIRMVIAYLFAQLLPWVRGRKGFLLVLGSSNIDEGLRGYMTKYDCSSADINPIGGMSKRSLLRMLVWTANKYDIPVLAEVAIARPTAELRPLADGTESTEHSQSDEADMGMTYEELGWYGFFRKVHRCGPVSLFERLCVQWRELTPAEVAEKVKRFIFYYAINRHKMTTLTPGYHAEEYSPDDNRYDLRPFLYNSRWERQFNTIDTIVAAEQAANTETAATASKLNAS